MDLGYSQESGTFRLKIVALLDTLTYNTFGGKKKFKMQMIREFKEINSDEIVIKIPRSFKEKQNSWLGTFFVIRLCLKINYFQSVFLKSVIIA